VTWRSGVQPTLLSQDDQIAGLAKRGKAHREKDAHIVLDGPILAVGKGG
jgi:hypothetical protein